MEAAQDSSAASFRGYGREVFVHDVDACYKAVARTIRMAAQLVHEVSSVRVAANRGGLVGAGMARAVAEVVQRGPKRPVRG